MSADPIIDRELLRRHDRPGPRYTSYPTAPQFSEAFGDSELRRIIHRSNAEPIPRPLSLYVHIPYCRMPCFYCGCNRIITRDTRKGERYVEHLLLEIERAAPLFARDRDALQVHFGGGTPNFLSPRQLGRVLRSLARQFHLSERSDRDFSIEIDPRYTGPGDIQALAEHGVNRASVGVQDFDPDVQRAVNRPQSVEQTLAVIDDCRRNRFRSVNVDLIYGLPRQSIDGFGRTLDIVISARPDRLAVYGYAHLPDVIKAQRPIVAAELPDTEARLSLLRLAIDRLTAAGYRHIGLDHFALPEDDLARAQADGTLQRNFMGYTTHPECDLVGFGISAISHIGDCYSQNPRELTAWEAALGSGRLPAWRGLCLTVDDVLRAAVIQQLMCSGHVDIGGLEHRFNIAFREYFADTWHELEGLADEGLLVLAPDSITVTSPGRYLLRIIAMCFDRYLQQNVAHATPARYSKSL